MSFVQWSEVTRVEELKRGRREKGVGTGDKFGVVDRGPVNVVGRRTRGTEIGGTSPISLERFWI